MIQIINAAVGRIFDWASRLNFLWKFLGVLSLAAAVIFGWHNQISRFDPDFRSPFDEHTHFDYWWRIYQQKTIPEVYDRIQHESLAIWSCYGDSRKLNPDCTPSGDGPTASENTASNYPPTFYVATAAMAWLLEPLIKTDNLFHLAKLANLAWGLISVVLVAWLALALKVPLLLTSVLVFAVAQTPAFVYAGITLNQEMFVLAFCLAGLTWYVRRTERAGSLKFVLESGVIAGICLSIKPTALLLPVVLVIAELLKLGTPILQRLKRVTGFSLVVVVVYFLVAYGGNFLRGINESDGVMRGYLLGRGTGDFQGWALHVWTSFTRSTASLHWRSLVDWDLPWLFMWFYPFVMLMLGLGCIHFVLAFLKKFRPALSFRLFMGAVVGFLVLPLALAVYLLFDDFPYFFQPRYYTAYIIIAVVLGAAALVDILREIAVFVRKEFNRLIRQRGRYVS